MSKIIDRIAIFLAERQYRHDLQRLEDIIMNKTTTYKIMKRVIDSGLKRGNLDKEDVMLKLDVFLIGNRISIDEYQELVDLMGTESESNA